MAKAVEPGEALLLSQMQALREEVARQAAVMQALASLDGAKEVLDKAMLQQTICPQVPPPAGGQPTAPERTQVPARSSHGSGVPTAAAGDRHSEL